MEVNINLAGHIEERLSSAVAKFIREAGNTASDRQQLLYLVGGAVRDLLLGRENIDIDLVVEGDAIALAQEIARDNRAEVTPHPRFGTAKVTWDGRSADIATARAETYDRPGALPSVRPGTIGDDLARRDFTINAMAVHLNPRNLGKLIDPHGGMDDLESGLVRVLHEKSFTDDATRIWRAVRYEQRLDFDMEESTLKLLQRDIDMLDTVSGDRVRHELELVFREEKPEKALRRADKLGALHKLHPSLKADDWLVETFMAARQKDRESPLPLFALYPALLAYRLTAEEVGQLIEYLRLPRADSQVLKDTVFIRENMDEMSTHGLAPSRVYSLLHGRDPTALRTAMLATGSPTAAEHIGLYLDALKNVRTALTGDDLKRMGVAEGPAMKDVLDRLREARLDGRVSSRQEEEEMVRGMSKKP